MTDKPKEYELVLWLDPASEFEGWQEIDKMSGLKLDLVYSVGWPVREDEVYLYLALDWSDGTAHTIGKIPHKAIQARKKVKMRGFPPKEKKKEKETPDDSDIRP